MICFFKELPVSKKKVPLYVITDDTRGDYMKESSDIILMIKTLKKVLKLKKISYAEIAIEIDVAVSTVKRWLSKGDISLKNLSAICSIAQISVFDLASIADKSAESFTLTEDQERFFADNLNYLSYFNRLFEGMTPKEIEKRFNLSKRSTKDYLKTLAQMKLIKFDVIQDVQVLKQGSFQWEDTGILGSVVSGDMIEQFSKKMVQKVRDRDEIFLKTVNWKMRGKTAEDLKGRIKNLLEEFTGISSLERKIYPEGELINLFALITLDQDYLFPFYEPIELYGDNR